MPIFITVDGIDGVGKTTACKLLAERIGAVYYKTPGEPFASLRHHVDQNIDPWTRYFFYRAAVQNDSRQIKTLLDEGKSVICDRYITTTQVSHALLDPALRELFEARNIVTPDHSFILTASPATCRQRIMARSGGIDLTDELESNFAYQSSVNAEYLQLGLPVISTDDKDPAQVVEAICAWLKPGAIRPRMNGCHIIAALDC